MAVDLSVSYRAPATARRMAEAANRWLQSLSPGQQDAARFPFETGERYIWNYRPVQREGLRLTNMDDQQAAIEHRDRRLLGRDQRAVDRDDHGHRASHAGSSPSRRRITTSAPSAKAPGLP